MKKKGVWIFLTILVAGSAFLISVTRKPETFYKKPSSSSFVQFKQVEEKDSDGDGLKDWEELLWKTDPNNPDTDGDGVSDAEEIRRQSKIISGNMIRDTETEEFPTGITQTETDILIEKLLNTYLALKETYPEASTKDLTSALEEPLTAEFSSYFDAELEDIYSLSDIKISESNTAEDAKKYGDLFASITLENFESLPDNITPIIGGLLIADNGLEQIGLENNVLTVEYDDILTVEELEKRNEENLSMLGKLAEAHFHTASEILELNVPGALVESHLVLTNQITFIGNGLFGVKDIFRDPLVALSSLNQYYIAITKAYEAMKKINIYFINNQIELEPENAEFFSEFK